MRSNGLQCVVELGTFFGNVVGWPAAGWWAICPMNSREVWMFVPIGVILTVAGVIMGFVICDRLGAMVAPTAEQRREKARRQDDDQGSNGTGGRTAHAVDGVRTRPRRRDRRGSSGAR